MSEWQKRILSSVLLLGFLGALVYTISLLPMQAQNPSWFVVIAILCFFMGGEWNRLIDPNSTNMHRILFAIVCSVTLAAWVYFLQDLSPEKVLLGIGVSAGVFLFVLYALWKPQTLLSPKHRPSQQRQLQGFGIVYIGIVSACFYSIITMDRGGLLFLILLLIVMTADIGAYIGGKRWGQRRLCPNISPGKTWVGAISGILAAVAVYLLIMSLLVGLSVFYVVYAIPFVVCIVILSMLGDLFISVLKRRSGLKDTGNLIPGHGGILDRVDGHIFAYLALFPVILLLQAYAVDIGTFV